METGKLLSILVLVEEGEITPLKAQKQILNLLADSDKKLFDAVKCDYAKLDNPNELYENEMKKNGVSNAVIESLEEWYKDKCN